MAQRYSARPSSIMGVADPYLAYVFDEAIAIRAALREQRETHEEANPASAPGQIGANGAIIGTLSGRIGEAL